MGLVNSDAINSREEVTQSVIAVHLKVVCISVRIYRYNHVFTSFPLRIPVEIV
jgi:hypothetical protein